MTKINLNVSFVQALYVAVRVVWMNDSFSWWHWIGFGGCAVVNLLIYSYLSSAAKPTYSETGELVSGGADLSTGNLSECVRPLHCLAAGRVCLLCARTVGWMLTP